MAMVPPVALVSDEIAEAVAVPLDAAPKAGSENGNVATSVSPDV